MSGIEIGSLADWFSGTMSALAIITALVAYPIANRQRRRDQLEKDKETGRAVGWKLLQVLNESSNIDRHFRTSLAKRDAEFPKELQFPLVRPLGIPETTLPDFNQSEIEFLLKNGGAELLMDGNICIRRQASIEHSMRQYTVRHEAFFDLMPSPIANEGMLFTHALTKEQHDKVMPYALMLDSLLISMIELVEENMKKCNIVLLEYTRLTSKIFGNPSLVFELSEDVKREIG